MTKENVKKLIPQVLKVLAFALVFVVLIQVLSVTVFDGLKISQVSKKRACAYSFVEDPENTTDVVCLGSSDIWSGFVPTELWEKYGYTSVVSSFSHQSVADAQSMLEQILKKQSPKLVILEIDTLMTEESLMMLSALILPHWIISLILQILRHLKIKSVVIIRYLPFITYGKTTIKNPGAVNMHMDIFTATL